MILWSRTRAWAEGGYYARVLLNVEGRAPEGAIDPADAEAQLEKLSDALVAMTDEHGRALGNRVSRPRDEFRATNGAPPDLMLFAGDLDLRALGEVGVPEIFVGSETAGASRHADGCNHDWEGLFVLAGPDVPRAGRREGASIYDVGATALRLLGVEVPEGWLGRDLRELPGPRAKAGGRS